MTATQSERALRDAAAVEPIGPDRFSVYLSQYYTIMGDRPNGGYLQCVLANAAVAAASAQGATHLHATAITTNYVGAPVVGPAEVHTEVRKVGRSVSFVHVTLLQDGRITNESLVTLGTLHDHAEPRYLDATPPELTPLDECRQSTGGEEINIMSVVDQRLDPSCAGWTIGHLSDKAEVKAWLKLNDGDAAWSVWSLLFASDAMPPATFPIGSSGWVPTLQLTSYIRQIPVGEWLRVRQWCVVISDDLVDERAELFDERGQLVASASQLAMVRFPQSS